MQFLVLSDSPRLCADRPEVQDEFLGGLAGGGTVVSSTTDVRRCQDYQDEQGCLNLQWLSHPESSCMLYFPHYYDGSTYYERYERIYPGGVVRIDTRRFSTFEVRNEQLDTDGTLNLFRPAKPAEVKDLGFASPLVVG